MAFVLVHKERMIMVLFVRLVATNVQPVSIIHLVHNVISVTISLTGFAHVRMEPTITFLLVFLVANNAQNAQCLIMFRMFVYKRKREPVLTT